MADQNNKTAIGVVGQGYVGKNYADYFEKRGFKVVRFSKEHPHCKNEEKIVLCDFVFVAVPTPTTPKGFDLSIVDDVLSLVGKGKIAVIKSTMLPGSTEKLQRRHKNIYVMHSPEFLREKSAYLDVKHPNRNIIGIPKYNDEFIAKAKKVIEILPRAPYDKIMRSREAELIKYAGNCFLFMKVVYANMLYDPRIGGSHLSVMEDKGRGAGGRCFIKDFAAFTAYYRNMLSDDLNGGSIFRAFESKNYELLTKSEKDLKLLHAVYGRGLK